MSVILGIKLLGIKFAIELQERVLQYKYHI